jgi:ribosomal protein S27AE
MEKKLAINKLHNLKNQIKESLDFVKSSTSILMKTRYINKLKTLLSEYEKVKSEFDTCTACGKIILDAHIQKKLAYQCGKMDVYLYLYICPCNKITIINKERTSECSGMCRPCDFHMVLSVNSLNEEE